MPPNSSLLPPISYSCPLTPYLSSCHSLRREEEAWPGTGHGLAMEVWNRLLIYSMESYSLYWRGSEGEGLKEGVWRRGSGGGGLKEGVWRGGLKEGAGEQEPRCKEEEEEKKGQTNIIEISRNQVFPPKYLSQCGGKAVSNKHQLDFQNGRAKHWNTFEIHVTEKKHKYKTQISFKTIT